MSYVLIIFIGVTHSSVDHIEFENQRDCLAARETVLEWGKGAWSSTVRAECVVKHWNR